MHPSPGPVVPPSTADQLSAIEDALAEIEVQELADQARTFAAIHQRLTTVLATTGEA